MAAKRLEPHHRLPVAPLELGLFLTILTPGVVAPGRFLNLGVQLCPKLLSLLKQFTHHKILQRVEYHLCPRRDIRKERQVEIDLPVAGPTGQDAVDIVDQIEAVLRCLLHREDIKPRDARILRAKLRGESSHEIARHVNCSVAQVNRVLAWIRPRFERALEEQAESSTDRS